MVCLCSSTAWRKDSALDLAASVAAQFLPKSKRSWEAVTVAVVVTEREVTVRSCEGAEPVTKTPEVETLEVEVTVWFWKPFHWPESWGRSGDRASRSEEH